MPVLAGIRRRAFPLTIFGIGLLATAFVAVQMRRTAAAEDERRFTVEADGIQDSILDRVQLYEAMLRAGAGLLAAADLRTPEQFRAFVERLQLPEQYPGVQGIGYTLRIDPDDVPRVIETQRSLGRPAFHIWPEYPRPRYHSILYLEPLDRRNQAAIGYDMFTEPVRRAAMERARDTGEPAASGLVTLVQEIDEVKQPGFLIYMPVYEGGAVPGTVEERRRRIRGFVYSPFRAGDLFKDILGRNPRPRAGVALFDGPPADGALIHRTAVRDRTGPRSTVRTLDVAGRRWTAEVFSTAALDEGSGARFVPLVLWGGTAITLILTGLAALQTRARERAERSEIAASDASRQFQQLANSISQLAWMAAPDGSIYWYNDRWYEYTGTTPGQMLGWGWQQVIDPGEQGTVLERWKHSLATGEPLEMEFPLRGADGGYRLFLTRAVPFRDRAGAIIHWFGTNTDVQYRRDAERQVQDLLARERAARSEAERVSRVKDEFLATLSHELRTPLNAVLGWAHMLSGGTLSEARRAAAIETILRNARMQSRLIEDLLDMSRIISDGVVLDSAPVNALDIVNEALNVVRPAAAARRIELVVHASRELCGVTGDSNRLQQVIWNLLTNAVKFTEPGGRVTIGVGHRDGWVEIAVTDTGIGIDPAFLPHVFDRFRQADGSATRGHGGLGLGLSIARSLVEMHGGTIDVASPGPNQGATFTVRLPAANPDARASAGSPDPRSRVPADVEPLRSLSILVVDDDADAGDLAKEILTQSGATVAVARSASEALHLLRANGARIDVIVSDLGMPHMDGYEFLDRVRSLPAERGGAAPAIALTAYAGAADRLRAIEAGYALHVAKPFAPRDLVSACATVAASKTPASFIRRNLSDLSH